MPVAVNVRDNVRDVVARMERYKAGTLDQAIPRALNRTADMAVTDTSRRMRAQGYNFKAADIKAAMRVFKASRSRPTASIKVRRQVKSLLEFGAVQTRDGVRVKVAGQAKLIRHAFIGQLRNGRLGVYIEDKTAGKTVLRVAKGAAGGKKRGGWHDYPVRKLYGPSIGGVYGTDKLQREVLQFIGQTFTARLAHELKQLSR